MLLKDYGKELYTILIRQKKSAQELKLEVSKIYKHGYHGNNILSRLYLQQIF